MKYNKKSKKRKKFLSKIKKQVKEIIIFKLCLIFIFIILYILPNKQIFHNRTEKITAKKITKTYDGRIFLCTSYNNEAEMAYIHIWRLYDYIDKFIFVVSNITHSGLPKNFSFKPFEENIKPYMDKIAIAYYNEGCKKNEYPTDNIVHCTEKSQRDYAKTYIEEHYNPTEKDLLIVVDVDEILTREGIELALKNPPKDHYFLHGVMYFPYYYHRIQDWDGGYIIRYRKDMKTLTKFRNSPNQRQNMLIFLDKPSKPLITHCSYCFKNIEEYKKKFKSFMHQQFNREPYITNDWIFKSHYCRFKVGSPLDGYDEPYEGWKHLIPDDPRLRYLVDRSFMYPLKQTNYTEKDLKTMCNKTFDRTPFEPSAKYKY